MAEAGHARKKPRTIIIGAGAAGMALAIMLRKAGFPDLVIYEKAGEVGGTWRENRYPGVGCDVPSHSYNYSFEHNPGWSSRLASGPELQQYMLKVCKKYDLRRDIVFNEEIKEAHFDGRHWHIRTSTGREDSGDFLVAATGPLHIPAYPKVSGLESFEGQSFHTARWPDNLDLKGKRVGIIGNGSSGTQVITALAEEGVDLTVFMRTPQWMFPLMNRTAGAFERKLIERFPWIGRAKGGFYGWFFEHVFAEAVIRPGWQRKFLQGACRWNLERVKDPELRKKLTPDYEPLCKWLVMSWDFYPAVSRPNVNVVRADVDHVDAKGVVDCNGVAYPLDVLVLATGFNSRAYHRPIKVFNEAGLSLDDAWKTRTAAHLSVHVPGFPNFMLLGGPFSPRGNFSAIAYSETIADHMVRIIRAAYENDWGSVSAKPEALDAFVEHSAADIPNTIWITGCRSWYLDEQGRPENWTGTPDEFREALSHIDFNEFDTVPNEAAPQRKVAVAQPTFAG